MENPEKLSTYTVHKTKKNATQYVLDTTTRKQTQTTETRHEPSHKPLEAKTNRTSLPRRNRNGPHNTTLRTERHIIGQHKQLVDSEQ